MLRQLFFLVAIHESLAVNIFDLINNGTSLEWIYETNNSKYYMTPGFQGDILDAPRERFNVTALLSDERITFRSVNRYGWAGIPDSRRKRLGLTNREVYFNIVRVEESGTHFHLSYEGELLVTPQRRPPFSFYLESQYPLESPATFSLQPYKFHLNSSYQGLRENILSTFDEIEKFENCTEALGAYATLLSEIEINGHTYDGAEIFHLGKRLYAAETNCDTSLVFQSLPQQVQNVVLSSSNHMQLFLVDSNDRIIPINANQALNVSSPIYPTNVTFPSESEWLMVSSAERNIYWTIYTSDLQTSPKSSASWFQFHLTQDNPNYFVVVRNYGQGLLRYRENAVTTFCVCPLNPVARFTMTPYFANILEMHGPTNKYDIPEIAFIMQKYHTAFSQRRLAFEKLLTSMEEHEHIEGTQVFSVGAYMSAALPPDDPVFQLLPETVRLLTSSESTLVSYVSEVGDQTFPLKYSWASDLHEKVLPYQFHHQISSNIADKVTTAISYGINLGQIHQIMVESSNSILYDILSSQPQYQFILTLHCNRVHFGLIYSSNPNRNVGTSNSDPDFYFAATNASSLAYFSIAKS